MSKGSAGAVLRAARGNRALARMLGAYAIFSIAEFGVWIVMLVYANARYGSVGAMAMVLVQLVPSMLLTPYSGSLADRLAPDRVLRASYLAQAALLGLAGATIAVSGPAPVVFALASAATIALDIIRPAQAALVPELARTPTELTTANVLGGWIDGAAYLAGPAVLGGVMTVGGVGAATIAAAGINLFAALLMRHDGEVSSTQRADDPGAPPRLRVMDDLRAAFATPTTKLLVVLTGFYYLMIGALDMICVLLAASLFHLGRGGAGYLNSAIGCGATVAGLATLTLAGRQRLAGVTVASLVAAIAALALIGAFPPVGVTIALLAVIGFMGTVFLTVTRTFLQRVAPPDSTAATFAAIEAVMSFGLAAGAVVVQVGIGIAGLHAALFALPVLGAVLIALTSWRLRAIDQTTVVPHVEIHLLRSIPIFSPLATPVIEGVARQLRPLSVPAGTAVVREGEVGDRYYAVADGHLSVTRGGTLLRTLSRGSGFGEIALIARSERTATVTADSKALLYGLDKDPFLRIMTGSVPSRTATDRVIAAYADPTLSDIDGEATTDSPGSAGTA